MRKLCSGVLAVGLFAAPLIGLSSSNAAAWCYEYDYYPYRYYRYHHRPYYRHYYGYYRPYYHHRRYWW